MSFLIILYITVSDLLLYICKVTTDSPFAVTTRRYKWSACALIVFEAKPAVFRLLTDSV